jgi:hypothetical protein
MLNSAHGVQFPILSSHVPCPLTMPIGACVKPSPTAPPITLNPAICSTSSGNDAKSSATFVNAPVATTQAVPGSVPRSASRAAIVEGILRIGAIEGVGSRGVPSRPVVPGSVRRCVSLVFVRWSLVYYELTKCRFFLLVQTGFLRWQQVVISLLIPLI